MRYRSAKKEKEYVERRKLVVRLLEEKPWCEACPVFAEHDEKKMYKRNQSSDLHELKRRSQGGSILDEENIICPLKPVLLKDSTNLSAKPTFILYIVLSKLCRFSPAK